MKVKYLHVSLLLITVAIAVVVVDLEIYHGSCYSQVAKKKGPVFQCLIMDCTEHGDGTSMVRHLLLKHTKKISIPFFIMFLLRFCVYDGEVCAEARQLVSSAQE